MKETYFFNEDCFNTMNRMIDKNYKINVILTSPPYDNNQNVDYHTLPKDILLDNDKIYIMPKEVV